MSIIAIASMLVTQAPIVILYQPKIGSSYKMSTSMAQTSQMGNSSTSMMTTSKVLGFENGFYKIQNTVSNFKMTGGMGGGDAAKKAAEKATIVYMDKHFKPKLEGGSNAAMNQMMSGMSSALSGVTFPSKPVKVGDTWTNTIDMGALMGAATKGQKGAEGMKSSGKINITYKLAKVDSSAVSINMTISGTVNMTMAGGAGAPGGAQGMKMSMTMTGGGTSSMERNTGAPLSSNTKMNMQMNFSGQPMNMTQTITSKRV